MYQEQPRLPWPAGQGRDAAQGRYRSAADINRQARRHGQAQRRRGDLA